MTKRLHDKPDHWSDIVGMPDDWDKKNIEALIKKFEHRRFIVEGFTISGKKLIDLCVAEAKRAHQLDGAGSIKNPLGIKSRDSGASVKLTLPVVLEKEITEAYPTMFRDNKHHKWFFDNFRQFRVAERY